MRCKAGGGRCSGHPHVTVLQQHRVDHVDDAVGALDVRTIHSNPVALPLDLVNCKEKRVSIDKSVTVMEEEEALRIDLKRSDGSDETKRVAMFFFAADRQIPVRACSLVEHERVG